ncbi:MAG: hypothetical protein H0X39_03850 [Actinobacteria bacterium]|nr:hypothetical protein [Actinomycetota bacterium]
MSDESKVLNIDAGDGGDWIKHAGGWDLWGRNGLIDNVRDLREWCACSRMTVEQFKRGQLYRNHVGTKGYAWLRDL